MAKSRIAHEPWSRLVGRDPMSSEEAAFISHDVVEAVQVTLSGHWQQAAAVTLQNLAGKAMLQLEEAARLSVLEQDVRMLRQQVEELRRQAPITVPVATLAPEPYDIMEPFQAVVRTSEDEYIASFFDANLSSSGSTPEQAVENLKDVIVTVFESFSAHEETRLGPGPKKQLRVLKRFLRRADEGGDGDNHEAARAGDSQEA